MRLPLIQVGILFFLVISLTSCAPNTPRDKGTVSATTPQGVKETKSEKIGSDISAPSSETTIPAAVLEAFSIKGTYEFREMPLREVLTYFSESTQQKIIYDEKDVDAQISINMSLNNMKISNVIFWVLRLNNLKSYWDGESLRVVKFDAQIPKSVWPDNDKPEIPAQVLYNLTHQKPQEHLMHGTVLEELLTYFARLGKINVILDPAISNRSNEEIDISGSMNHNPLILINRTLISLDLYGNYCNGAFIVSMPERLKYFGGIRVFGDIDILTEKLPEEITSGLEKTITCEFTELDAIEAIDFISMLANNTMFVDNSLKKRLTEKPVKINLKINELQILTILTKICELTSSKLLPTTVGIFIYDPTARTVPTIHQPTVLVTEIPGRETWVAYVNVFNIYSKYCLSDVLNRQLKNFEKYKFDLETNLNNYSKRFEDKSKKIEKLQAENDKCRENITNLKTQAEKEGDTRKSRIIQELINKNDCTIQDNEKSIEKDNIILLDLQNENLSYQVLVDKVIKI